ncbi:MAG: type VII toxin-antitoxin system HepT family RNase toxin [Bacillota bacterium]
MDKDIIINKSQVIERCITRIHEEYNCDTENLKNYTKQDSIILNIQRACEACIDLAMHIVSEKKLGVPQTSREVFDILKDNGIMDDHISERLKAMVGFRNVAVPDYQNIKIEIIERIIQFHLGDMQEFAGRMIKAIEN